MVAEPDRLKDDIAATRSDLARDVDALADRTLPGRVARRRWDRMRERMQSMSERLMGPPSDMAAEAAEKVGDVATAVKHAPQRITQGAQGNPLAAGLIAFGVGLLTASWMPTTGLERRVGQQLKENATDLVEPLREPLASSAHELKATVTESVVDAADRVKETATQAAQTTVEQATALTPGAEHTPPR
jgi:hypothetical protein